jgi:hypothetical protein
MKTINETAPIETPAWANQFINLCDLLAGTCRDHEDAARAAILSLGCMADLANVRSDAYGDAAHSTRAYIKAAALDIALHSAYRLTPSSDKPSISVHGARTETSAYRAAGRAALELALCNLRPSLRLS